MTRALKSCSPLPNCVSSRADDAVHRVKALDAGADPAAAWAALREILKQDSTFTIVEEEDDYLHAEARTPTLGFVDDIELLLQETAIDVRSASRVGLYDLGTNRRRVESLRRKLAAALASGNTPSS